MDYPVSVYKNISIIVAIAKDFGIGFDNRLLFHLPDDLKRFREITSGHSLIMGRNTLLSLPKWPLPNRRHIVLTDNKEEHFKGCEMVYSLAEALGKVDQEEEVFVIGGSLVYRQFYPISGKLYLTLVDKTFEADTYFPTIAFNEWKEISKEDFYDKKNKFKYSYINLVRS